MSVIKAVFKRNVASFFGNPAGYVFIILFVGMSAWFAFVTEAFFAANQANLNSLTIRMPLLLMLFVSSVTMTTWAEERKLGTDELLFTLPSGDFSVVFGKFLANLAILTATLVFTLSHVLILCHLGDPDIGLMVSTYLGYWLMGAAFIATGMFASSLTNNITVGFIYGVLFCAVFAFAQQMGQIFPGRMGAGINAFAAVTHLASFGRGVVALEDIVYFLSISGGMLYLNSVVLSRRRWPGGSVPLKVNPRLHVTFRVLAVIVIIFSVNVLFARFGGRMDITEEKLSSLSKETQRILADLDSDKPVYIQAWISEDVPVGYVDMRDNLLGLLREYDELGGDALRVKVNRPEPFSEEAREAKDKFEIQAAPVFTQEGGETSTTSIFMGAAILCGVEEEVIPFFHAGIPIEYELTRTIRVVSKAERPKVGFVDNELKLFGGFDFQTRSRSPSWQVVDELRKQYDVENLNAESPIPEDMDVVVAALPSLLKDNQLDTVISAIKKGMPTLLLVDPLPIINPGLSPRLPRPSPQTNPFMRQPPSSDPKCDLNRLLTVLGVRWNQSEIAWDISNPNPALRHLPPEFVFITASPEGKTEGTGFSPQDEVASGLQELLAFFSGTLSKMGSADSKLTFEPLLRTSDLKSGTTNWNDCVAPGIFGMGYQISFDRLERLTRRATPQDYILAARIRGEMAVEEEPSEEEEEGEEEKGEEEKEPASPKTARIDVILVADLDLISDQMFELRKRNLLNLDNVPFILNCVDSLAKDDSYIALRKRRRVSRTLTKIEELNQEHEQAKLDKENQANMEAQLKLAEAQAEFNRKVKEIEDREDLDVRTKGIQVESLKMVEQRRLSEQKARIEEEKEKKNEESRYVLEQAKRRIRVEKKVLAVILPIIPLLIIAVAVFLVRVSRETLGAEKTRLLRD